jgi:uncharacterized protein (DUF2141 family)
LKLKGKNIKGSIMAALHQSADGFPGDQKLAFRLKEVKVLDNVVTLVFPGKEWVQRTIKNLNFELQNLKRLHLNWKALFIKRKLN